MAFVTPLTRTSFLSQRQAAVCRTRTQPVSTAITMSLDVPDVLAKIIDRKKVEVAELKSYLQANPSDPIAEILANRGSLPRKKAFFNALNLPQGSLTVIAEIKRRSPSKGHIGTIADPTILSRVYYEGGAGAISVLTDLEGFGGTMDDLKAVVNNQEKNRGNYPGPCPVIRKDFTIDEVQIAEAAAGGASAVLLIVAALGKERTKELLLATHEMGLDALVEVHDEAEVEMALEAGAEIVGVNNRNLRTFEVSLENSFRLAKLIPDDKVKIAESGIKECIDAWKLRDAGFSAILVGETLVKAYEQSGTDSSTYIVGYNQARGYIKAFKAKGSVEFGNADVGAFYGKGEGAKETLGEISI